MANNCLVIVESPSKIKSIRRHLNVSHFILATFGHICDLVPKKNSIGIRLFDMKYQIVYDKLKYIKLVFKYINICNVLYLATDPDREGEVISWHLFKILDENKKLSGKIIYRIVFNEITGFAIKRSILNSRRLCKNLIYSQQTRRALDYLVGFNLSSLLWKKVRIGLSAGRVQSPTLRIIIDRENEINSFILKKEFNIEVNFLSNNFNIFSKIIDDKNKNIDFNNNDNAKRIINNLSNDFKVYSISIINKKKCPKEPFRTSTLQQEAIKQFSFSAHQTMIIAQQLYEGVDIGFGQVGLISYIRTDSIYLSLKIMKDIKNFIYKKYGRYIYYKREFKLNIKNKQEAHEAIRPTFINIIPQNIKHKLTKNQYYLYDLIWRRTLSCQMKSSIFNVINFKIINNGYLFNLFGKKIIFDGFIFIYNNLDKFNNFLMTFFLKENLILLSINKYVVESSNKPIFRYTEAMLIKLMEKYGIGRPSTYTTIIYTLRKRGYVTFENKIFKPTDIGIIVNKFLFDYFSLYVDYDFTSKMENALDYISRGECNWIFLIRVFWRSFYKLMNKVTNNINRENITHVELNEKCYLCSSKLFVKLGKSGKFIGCSNFPNCKYTRNINIINKKCLKCDGFLIARYSKYGKFFGCCNYPICDFVDSFYKLKVSIKCPLCSNGNIIMRKYKKNFYTCDKYPVCSYNLFNLPIDESCYLCNSKILIIKKISNIKFKKECCNKECHYFMNINFNSSYYNYYIYKYFF